MSAEKAENLNYFYILGSEPDKRELFNQIFSSFSPVSCFSRVALKDRDEEAFSSFSLPLDHFAFKSSVVCVRWGKEKLSFSHRSLLLVMCASIDLNSCLELST